MSVTVKINQKKLLKVIKEKNKNFLERVRKEYTFTSWDFIKTITEMYYTTRNDDDTGLYSVSGTLRKSWSPEVVVAGNDVIAQIGSKGAKYGKIHEYGKPVGEKLEPGATKKPRPSPAAYKWLEKNPPDRIPQRTFVREDFRGNWIPAFAKATKVALREFNR